MVTKDPNCIITSWNAGAERLFGYTAEEVIGRPVSILIPPKREDEEPVILQRIRSGDDRAYEVRPRSGGAEMQAKQSGRKSNADLARLRDHRPSQRW